jgi:hypothetical protein
MGYQLIETIEVGSGGAASIEFTSIPQDGVDLLLVLSGRATTTQTNALVTFNSSSSNFSWRLLNGNGSSANSFSDTTQFFLRCSQSSDTSSTFGNSSLYVSNYASSAYKSVSIDSARETNATAAALDITAGLWSNTNAITSIGLSFASGNFAQYSTASLYKITAD